MSEIKVEHGAGTRVDKVVFLDAHKAAEHMKEDQPRKGAQISDPGSGIANLEAVTSENPVLLPPQHAHHNRNVPKGASRAIWEPIVLSPQVLEILQVYDCSDSEFVAWLHKNGKDETFIPSKHHVLFAKAGYAVITDMDLESHDHHKHPCEHHGAIGSVLHAIHLDRDSRKEERREDKQDEAEWKGKIDMEQWEQSLLMSHRSEEHK